MNPQTLGCLWWNIYSDQNYLNLSGSPLTNTINSTIDAGNSSVNFFRINGLQEPPTYENNVWALGGLNDRGAMEISNQWAGGEECFGLSSANNAIAGQASAEWTAFVRFLFTEGPPYPIDEILFASDIFYELYNGTFVPNRWFQVKKALTGFLETTVFANPSLGTTSFVVNIPQTAYTWVDLAIRVYNNAGVGRIEVWADGVLQGSTNTPEPFLAPPTNQGVNLGRRFNGYFAEQFWFNKKLSDTELQEMFVYLDEKYNTKVSCINYCNENEVGSVYISGTTCDGITGAYFLNVGECLCLDDSQPLILCDNPTLSGTCEQPDPTPLTPTPSNTPGLTPTPTTTITPTPSETPCCLLPERFVMGFRPYNTPSGGNALAYSNDGINVSGSSPNANSFFFLGGDPNGITDIATNGSMYVAVGNNGRLTGNAVVGLYSTNGTSWAESNLQSIKTGRLTMEACMWDGSQFHAIGTGDPALVKSNDGTNWTGFTNATTNLSISSDFPAIREGFIYYDGTDYWIGNRSLYKSNNGTNYTLQAGSFGMDRFMDMLYHNNTHILVGYIWGGTFGTSIPSIQYSTDNGTTWSAATGYTGLTQQILCLETDGNIILAGSAFGSNRMFYSYDGISWSANTAANALFGQSVFDIAWNGTMFVAIGEENSAVSQEAYSFDGLSWTAMTTTLLNDIGQAVVSIPQPENIPPVQQGCCPSPTPTPSITPSNTATPSNTPSVTPTRTQTPSVTPTRTTTPSVTPTNTNTPSITATNTSTPTITPSITPSPTASASCECLCWSMTYTPPLNDPELQVRWRDCQTNTIITDDILNLETFDNLDGTYTVFICVRDEGSYSSPTCVLNGIEVTCDPYVFEMGGVCCIPGDCY